MQNTNSTQNFKIKDLRVFGLIWSGLLLTYGLWPLFNDLSPRLWSVAIGLIMFLIAVFSPNLFIKTRVYQAWIKFGNVLGLINSKIILGLLFFVVITPMGVIMRIFGKDLLAKKVDKNKSTYFVKRTIQPGSMSNQF